jgi:hypothetical protein
MLSVVAAPRLVVPLPVPLVAGAAVRLAAVEVVHLAEAVALAAVHLEAAPAVHLVVVVVVVVVLLAAVPTPHLVAGIQAPHLVVARLALVLGAPRAVLLPSAVVQRMGAVARTRTLTSTGLVCGHCLVTPTPLCCLPALRATFL